MEVAIHWIREAELAANNNKVKGDRETISPGDDIPVVAVFKLESTPIIDFQEHAAEVLNNILMGIVVF